MQYSTLTQIKTRLNNECDLFDEGFIEQDTELLGYINSAIDDAEASIHSLYEDYFLNRATITLVSGTATYSAPSDIFANKIRALQYNSTVAGNGYPIRKIKRLSEVLYYANTSASTSVYKYLITNDVTAGIKINFFPTPNESGPLIDTWYIRNAKTLSNGSDSCDIPEFINFIYAHVKYHVARKEKMQIDLATAKEEYLDQKALMEKTLTDMIPSDDGTEIEKDFSFYKDFDSSLEMRGV